MAIGIDIGGTKIRGGIINEQGRALNTLEVPTNINNGREAIVADVLKMVDKLLNNGENKVEVVGIGSAGRINVDKGTVYYATPNLPEWTSTPLREWVESQTHIPTVVDNDVNTAVLAEGWIGAAVGSKNYVCITLGTGVGGGIVCNGKLVRGEKWGAGEVGHMLLYPGGIPCNCGQQGCWEQYVSGSALNREAEKLSLSRQMEKSWSARDLLQAAENGDEEAIKVVNQFTQELAFGIISLHNIINPECVLIGGGLITTEHIWWQRFYDDVQKMSRVNISLKKTHLGNNAGMLGAAKLGFDYMETKLP